MKVTYEKLVMVDEKDYEPKKKKKTQWKRRKNWSKKRK